MPPLKIAFLYVCNEYKQKFAQPSGSPAICQAIILYPTSDGENHYLDKSATSISHRESI
jgi:hypothetical protein